MWIEFLFDPTSYLESGLDITPILVPDCELDGDQKLLYWCADSPLEQFEHVVFIWSSKDLEPLQIADVRLLILSERDGRRDRHLRELEQQELRGRVGIGRPTGRLVVGVIHQDVTEGKCIQIINAHTHIEVVLDG